MRILGHRRIIVEPRAGDITRIESGRTHVNSIVNYEGFTVEDEATEAYMDAVRYVEKKYYRASPTAGSCA